MNTLLKREKNFNLICHSCVSENPAECKSLLNIMPLDSRVKPENDKEVGRSMVEMLGVLAVIGVLSVAGIAGYNNAMNRHRANELLYEASKRATVVAMQVASGNGSQLSVAEFGDNAWSVTSENLTNQFGIKTPSVGAEVCKQVVNSVGTGTLVRKVLSGTTDATNDASKCADAIITFVYNNDLSTTDITPAQVTCEDSEKEEKTYYIGACCNVSIKGKFCPGEEVPTCTKMDEDACACTTPECCNNADGTWKNYNSSGGYCSPKGATEPKCAGSGSVCISCPPNEFPVCGTSSGCTCGKTATSAACGYSSCINCTEGEIAGCHPIGICICCKANQNPVCTPYGPSTATCSCEDL